MLKGVLRVLGLDPNDRALARYRRAAEAVDARPHEEVTGRRGIEIPGARLARFVVEGSREPLRRLHEEGESFRHLLGEATVFAFRNRRIERPVQADGAKAAALSSGSAPGVPGSWPGRAGRQ